MMQFDIVETKRLRIFVQEENSLPTLDTVVHHNLQFYGNPPFDSISLIEFETLALERLKLLKEIELIRERCSDNDTLNSELFKCCSKHFPIAITATSIENKRLDATKERALESSRRRDHNGHFILRLAFCRSPELTKWFLTQEMELFRYRFSIESKQSIDKFLAINGFQMTTVGIHEKNELFDKLSSGSAMNHDEVKLSDFWKIPFTEALELVSNRRVFLNCGHAYVPRLKLISIISAKFRQNMSRAMAKASKYFSYIQEEERLGPFLTRLSNKAYMGKDYCNETDDGNRVTPNMIDELARISFPLCMSQLHAQLRSEHHLRHGGRMQYGLFLKGIGMTLEDALGFWRKEFLHKIDSDKGFDKQYAYNIRHNYGKEGKRANYTPYHCPKIVNSSLGTQDSHGCPFKHCDVDALRRKLETLNISNEQTKTILDFCKVNRYDRACTRFFEITHRMADDSLGQVITHPNSYYEESRKILSEKRTNETVQSTKMLINDQTDEDGNHSLSMPCLM